MAEGFDLDIRIDANDIGEIEPKKTISFGKICTITAVCQTGPMGGCYITKSCNEPASNCCIIV